MSSRPKPSEDVGIAAVEGIFRAMLVDAKWCERRPRGFTWWSYRLAQHVEASEPFTSGDGATASLVRVWTDVVTDVPVSSPEKTNFTLSLANSQATMSALVWSHKDSTIRECLSSVVYADTIDGWVPVMAMAAVLQNTAAHSRAHSVAEAVGGKPAASDHPEHGQRSKMDDILNVPAAGVDLSGAGSAFSGVFMKELVAATDAHPLIVLGSGDETSLTAEFSFSNAETAVKGAKSGEADASPETSLLQALTTEPHPQLGSGALLLLRLPVSLGEFDRAAEIANTLNELEAAGEGPAQCTFMGGWSAVESGHLAFATFVPSSLARSGLLVNLFNYDAFRSQWAASELASLH